MSEIIRVAVAGCGSRGHDTYSVMQERFADRMKIVAAADPDPVKLERMRHEFDLAPSLCFATAEEMLGKDQLADVCFICTPDGLHYPHAMAALRKGYHLLLEKPIAQTAQQCIDISKLAAERCLHVVVCHVLRYTAFYQKIRELINEGAVGKLMSMQALEQVGYWHQAHSYVRGNWRSSTQTTPMILAKSCHDLDILLWLSGKHCKYVSSYGSLRHFRKDQAPQDAPDRCTKPCPVAETCPYNAETIYLGQLERGETGWPVNVLNTQPTMENIRIALEEGPYGRCVYHCDNDVVDHQVVNMELEDGVTVDFNMSAFTWCGGRHIRVMGSDGDIVGDMEHNIIHVRRFGQEEEVIDVRTLTDDFSGHGGGDARLLDEFLTLVATGKMSKHLTSVEASVESHLACFAAEESRLHHGQSIKMAD